MSLKFPFSIRILEERLSLERTWLEKFNRVLFNGDNGNKYWKEFAEENIHSCTYRIEELESSISELKKFSFSKNYLIFVLSNTINYDSKFRKIIKDFQTNSSVDV
jgi:hypothetical protein